MEDVPINFAPVYRPTLIDRFLNICMRLYCGPIYWLHSCLRKLGAPTCWGVEGPCFQIGYTYRQRTMYVEEESNWVHLCPDCQKINDEHWDEMWSDYYRDCL